jgi:hypothetical protein
VGMSIIWLEENRMDILDLTHLKFESKEAAIQFVRSSSTLNNKTQSQTNWDQQFAEVQNFN